MKRILVLTLAALAVVLGFAAPAQAATGKIEFTRIVYNPPGRDNHAKLNWEYVRVTNHSPVTTRMNKWSITDKDGHTFTFPHLSLEPGKDFIVHTGHGVNGVPSRGHLYQQSDHYIWDNSGDKATLRSASGRVYDTCAYRPNGGGLTYCV